jgi:hypothetical protein
MKSATFLRQGIHSATKTPLYIAELLNFQASNRVEFPSKPLAFFIAADSSGLSADDIGRLAEKLLNQGLRYLCAWGPDCERVHDIFDEMYVGDGTEPYKFELMTTWHDADSFGEALSFFLNSTYVEDKPIEAASYAVRIGNPPESGPLAEVIQRIEEFLSD